MAKKMTKKELNAQKAKSKALSHALTGIRREFGKGSIMKFSDDPNADVERVSTGLPSLDFALGGGLPKGRILEFFGNPSGGKSTLALTCVAAAQKQGLTCAYIDAENALDPDYAKKLGVNTDDLLISQPDYGEEGLQICDGLVSSGAVGLVVVDSVAALVPRVEVKGQMGDQNVGVQARMMSQGLRKLSGSINKTNTIVIFINQIREKVGVMFGNPETTPGGRALKFYDSIRLRINQGQKIKQGTNVIGNHCNMRVTKNKVAPPFKRAKIDLYYGKGFSEISDILNLASKKGIIDKAGSWYSYGDTKIGQGSTNAQKFIAQHPDLHREIEIKVRKAYNMPIPKDLTEAQQAPTNTSSINQTTSNSKSTKKSSSKKNKKSNK